MGTRCPVRLEPRLYRYQGGKALYFGVRYSVLEIIIGASLGGYEIGTGIGYSMLTLILLIAMVVHGGAGALRADSPATEVSWSDLRK